MVAKQMLDLIDEPFAIEALCLTGPPRLRERPTMLCASILLGSVLVYVTDPFGALDCGLTRERRPGLRRSTPSRTSLPIVSPTVGGSNLAAAPTIS
jgi:hypothetical protein